MLYTILEPTLNFTKATPVKVSKSFKYCIALDQKSFSHFFLKKSQDKMPCSNQNSPRCKVTDLQFQLFFGSGEEGRTRRLRSAFGRTVGGRQKRETAMAAKQAEKAKEERENLQHKTHQPLPSQMTNPTSREDVPTPTACDYFERSTIITAL